jgi:hypothetical protein
MASTGGVMTDRDSFLIGSFFVVLLLWLLIG